LIFDSFYTKASNIKDNPWIISMLSGGDAFFVIRNEVQVDSFCVTAWDGFLSDFHHTT
jgi:hypothetical protein